MTKMQNVEQFEEPMANLHNSSDCIEISNYISRQSTQRGDLIFHDDGPGGMDSNHKSTGHADKFEYRLGNMKAKLD